MHATTQPLTDSHTWQESPGTDAPISAPVISSDSKRTARVAEVLLAMSRRNEATGNPFLQSLARDQYHRAMALTHA